MNNDLLTEMNWLPIAVSTIIYFFIGAIWYTVLFGKKWIAYQQINVNDPKAKEGSGVIMFMSFLLMAVAVICIALLVERMQLTQAVSGIKLGLLTGIGFAITAISISYLYVKKPLGLHIIDGSYHLVGHIISAVILCIWK
jgi:hypothetical protein